jgi:glutathione synthase/RimK-type ligase-like ATP-grasp enzyme
MKSFLILGHPLDPHAHYVAWALGTAGYQTIFINSAHDNCPTRTTLYIDKDVDDFTALEWNDAEAIWCRRLSSPPRFHPSDGQEDQFCLGEEQRFTKWLIGMQEDHPIRWINRPSAGQAAENKFRQLRFAKFHGIRIPRTLVTAQPDRFRGFLRTEGVIVAKGLDAYSWEESGESLAAFATVLDYERGSQLSDEDIAKCVTIYQERIDKAADLRMVVMGADVFAYKITQNGEQHLDYRIGFFKQNHLRYEPISVPAALRKKMVRFMDSLGINFASADFALTADGEFIFLDLNPNGQWLFIEAECPESRVGQKFCSFFTKGRVDHGTENLFRSFLEYRESDAGRSFEETFRRSAAQAQPTALVKREAQIE